ncbi:hypothetical protein D3C84_1298160 [compost metagenome]
MEHPLFQNHGIRASQQQPLHLSLLSGNLLIARILIDHASEILSQNLPCPLEGADTQ